MFRESSTYWQVPSVRGVEFFKAVFNRHAYVLHTHEMYTLAVIEEGVQTFHCRGAQRIVPPLGIVTINPDETHDGRSFDRNGYRYRATYVEPDLYRELILELAPRYGGLPFFRQPVLCDEHLANAFLTLHRLTDAAARREACPMEQQSRMLSFLANLALRHAEDRPRQTPPSRDHGRVARAIEYMRAGLARRLTLDEVAVEVGLSRYYFLRMFRSVTGMPPHTYLCQLRLEAARNLMLAGCPLAQVALRVGFYDQSHFTNRFRRTFGVAPGEYVRSHMNRNE